MPFLFYDIRYMMFMLPAILIMALTQWYVSSAYNKWSRVANRFRMSGAEAAQRLISAGGLPVRVEGAGGTLSDHYDPRTKTLRLSPGVYQGQSVASLAIAAHELGHAMQDNEGYFPLKVRAALVPMVNIGSYLGWILIIIGLMIRGLGELSVIGLVIFSGGALFALATLPVELNASARARRLLTDSGLISTPDEQKGVNTVLNAAALTYVAALITAILQLLYWAMIIFGGNRRRS